MGIATPMPAFAPLLRPEPDGGSAVVADEVVGEAEDVEEGDVDEVEVDCADEASNAEGAGAWNVPLVFGS